VRLSDTYDVPDNVAAGPHSPAFSNFLIGLLDVKDRVTHSMTLGLLNELEFGRRMGIPAWEMPHQPVDYRKLSSDPAFRAPMTAAIRLWNAQSKNRW
jgi:hypothetical protein